MDNTLKTAKFYLNKVGGSLMTEMKNDPSKATRIKEVLNLLKKANEQINSIDNPNDDFSFDDMDSLKSVKESENSMGVDLGDFDNMISAPKSNNKWKEVFKEGNKNGGVDLSNVDLHQNAYDNILGRMIDNT